MKKIEAIIRPEKLSAVRQALEEVGYPGITITEVKGHGKQRGLVQQWRGQAYRIEYLSKVKIEVVVLDEDEDKTITAIVRKARSGEIGDGKVFVYPVENAVSVRTGEAGVNAI
ncbi:MAG TPA: P-II family nitrogen regulator [Dehalococcoidia bacterium]|nr:P-II family nitrogen regulator [Dehalococcoidia bacterium]